MTWFPVVETGAGTPHPHRSPQVRGNPTGGDVGSQGRCAGTGLGARDPRTPTLPHPGAQHT